MGNHSSIFFVCHRWVTGGRISNSGLTPTFDRDERPAFAELPPPSCAAEPWR